MASLCLAGTCYDGFQSFSSKPYNELKVEFEEGRNEDSAQEDKVETMRVNIKTKSDHFFTILSSTFFHPL